jgi:hypothetical protein
MLPVEAGVAAGMRLWFHADVAFDRAAAEQALGALRSARAALDDLAECRVRAGRAATDEWRGAHRDDFEREFRRTQAALVDGIACIESTIRDVAAAMDEAELDQARRLRLRAEHLADLARQHILP